MKRWTVVDTNVLVSGVFSAHSGSPRDRIVDAMLAGRLRFLVSEELVFEYRRVLVEPRALRRHGMREDEIDGLLGALLENAAIRTPSGGGPSAPEALDRDLGDPPPVVPGDEHVVALLDTESLAVLVTGDRVLTDALRGWREVFSPGDFASRLDPSGAGFRESS